MIILMGYVHLHSSDINEFMEDVQPVISSTRVEKGCHFYAFTIEDAHAGRLLTVQQWQDQESLTAHIKKHESMPFLKKWGTRIDMDINQYDVLNKNAFSE